MFVEGDEMPELAPATQESYRMPASVAPCIIDEQSHMESSDLSRVSVLPEISVLPDVSSAPSDVTIPNQPSPVAPQSPAASLPSLPPYGGASDDDDDNDGGGGDDYYNDDASTEPEDEATLEPVSLVNWK